jgi:hypothetical protein
MLALPIMPFFGSKSGRLPGLKAGANPIKARHDSLNARRHSLTELPILPFSRFRFGGGGRARPIADLAAFGISRWDGRPGICRFCRDLRV